MGMVTMEELLAVPMYRPNDQPDTVQVLLYKGTIWGVFATYDDAYHAAVSYFGDSAIMALDVTILSQKIRTFR